ncbi:hypothetical protein MMM2322_02461 [Microbacterium sp. MM2322]
MSSTPVDLAYRRRSSGEPGARWSRRNLELVRSDGFGILAQISWAMRASWLVLATRGRYSHIHLHGAYWVNLIPALMASKSTSLVVLPVLEGGDLRTSGKWSSAAKRILLRHIVRRAHRIYVLSDGIRAEALALGAEEQQVLRIANPVSDEFSVDRTAPPAEDFPLLFCGKLGPIKQPHLILEVVRRLRDVGVPARAIFVGPFINAEYEKKFRAASEDVSEFITLVGYVSNASSVYSKSLAAFVLPSRAEGLPGALAEAMFSGLPSVVSDVGAMGDVIRRSGGGFVISDVDEMVASLQGLAANPDEWGVMSRGARDYATAEFSTRAVAAAYLGGLEKGVEEEEGANGRAE